MYTYCSILVKHRNTNDDVSLYSVRTARYDQMIFQGRRSHITYQNITPELVNLVLLFLRTYMPIDYKSVLTYESSRVFISYALPTLFRRCCPVLHSQHTSHVDDFLIRSDRHVGNVLFTSALSIIFKTNTSFIGINQVQSLCTGHPVCLR